MTDTIKTHACPNCGAPIALPDFSHTPFSCPYCGTTLSQTGYKTGPHWEYASGADGYNWSSAYYPDGKIYSCSGYVPIDTSSSQ